MNALTPQQQKEFISHIQSKLDTLPKHITNADILTTFDMIEQHEELQETKTYLTKSVADGSEPFYTLFHSGSDDGLAFQITMWVSEWSIDMGERSTNGEDFLTPYNSVTIPFKQYSPLTITGLVDSVFRTLTSMLSGNIQILGSKYASGSLYGTELLITTESTKISVATSWFGGKSVEQPASTAIIKNTLIPIGDDDLRDSIFLKRSHGKPLLSGRVFIDENYTPLTYGEFKKYKRSPNGGSIKSLKYLYIAFLALYIGVVISKFAFPNSPWPLIVVGISFIVLIALMAKKFPYLLLMAFGPLLAGFAAFGVFAAIGSGLYYLIPQINDAVNSHNIPLSMTIVLGWGFIGLIIGIITFVKVEKKLQAVAIAKTDILK